MIFRNLIHIDTCTLYFRLCSQSWQKLVAFLSNSTTSLVYTVVLTSIWHVAAVRPDAHRSSVGFPCFTVHVLTKSLCHFVGNANSSSAAREIQPRP